VEVAGAHGAPRNLVFHLNSILENESPADSASKMKLGTTLIDKQYREGSKKRKSSIVRPTTIAYHCLVAEPDRLPANCARSSHDSRVAPSGCEPSHEISKVARSR